MKKVITTLMISNLVIGSAFSAHPHDLSRCEQSLVASLPKAKTERNISYAGNVGMGIISGIGAQTLVMSSETVASSSEVSVNTTHSPTPEGKILFSAVAVGVAAVAIGIGGTYLDYRAYVDTNEGVLLLFKDVKNGGMGPEIELRTRAIQRILTEVDRAGALKKFFKKLKKYNPETYKEENVVDEIVNVSNKFLESEVIDCENANLVSQSIDEKVIANLITKYNPDIKKAELK